MIKLRNIFFLYFTSVLCFSSFTQNTSKVNGYGSLQWGNSIEILKRIYPNIVELPAERYCGNINGEINTDYVYSEDVAVGVRIFKEKLSGNTIKNRFF